MRAISDHSHCCRHHAYIRNWIPAIRLPSADRRQVAVERHFGVSHYVVRLGLRKRFTHLANPRVVMAIADRRDADSIDVTASLNDRADYSAGIAYGEYPFGDISRHDAASSNDGS